MKCFHLTLATVGRRHAVPDEASVLVAVEVIVRVAGPRLVLFCVVDDHVHVVVRGTRDEAGRLARGILLALRAALPDAGFGPAHIEPVEHRRHLHRLLPYVLRQTEHHDLPWHPARWAGSCFADLVGARVLEGFEAENLFRLLPRLSLEEILDAARATRQAIQPVGDEALGVLGPLPIVGGAAAAVGRPSIAGKAPPEAAARRAAVRLLDRGGWTAKQAAEHLRISPRAVRRIAARGADERVERAARMQIQLGSSIAPRRRPTRPG